MASAAGQKAATRRLLPVLLAALAPVVSSQSHLDVAHIESENEGCFHKGFQWTPDIPGTNIETDSLVECQTRCANMTGCAVFAYFPWTKECYFGDQMAQLVEGQQGAIAGHGVCPTPTQAPVAKCSTELPLNGFPGIDSNLSQHAWPSGRQPYSLECWPKDWLGGYQACSIRSILEDTTKGWPGKCRNLEKQTITAATCKQDCEENPLCAVWQTGWDQSCWQGTGESCFVRQEFAPDAAARLQHGLVRVLMDLKGWEIMGLYKKFDNVYKYFENEPDAANACKMICYSDIRCQFWTYAPKYGCYTEDASRDWQPPWPLTLDFAFRSTVFALDSIGGELIQHYCPTASTTVWPTTPAPPLSPCMEKSIRYHPVDMPGTGRTVEMNADACQARCARTFLCSSFAFWPDGGCHLAMESAKPVPAEDWRVIAGPAQCSATPEPWPSETPPPSGPSSSEGSTKTIADNDFFTKDGRAALTGQATSAPAPPPPPPVVKTGSHVAGVTFTVKNLNFAVLTRNEKAGLKGAYLHTLSRFLGVNVVQIWNKPPAERGLPAKLQLKDGPAPSCTLRFYTLNQPSTTSNVSHLAAIIRSPTLESELAKDTTRMLAVAHDAILGPIQVADPHVSAFQHVESPHPAAACGFWCRWWPILTGLLLLLCVSGVVAAIVLMKPAAEGRSSKRGVTVPTSEFGRDTSFMESGIGSEYSDDEGDPSVWAEEPSWDGSSSRAQSSPQRDPYGPPDLPDWNGERRGQFTV